MHPCGGVCVSTSVFGDAVEEVKEAEVKEEEEEVKEEIPAADVEVDGVATWAMRGPSSAPGRGGA